MDARTTAMTADELQQFLADEFPQIEGFNFRIESVGPDGARIRMPVDHAHLRPGGTVSGPTMMTLADVSMYVSVLARIGPVGLAVTTGLTINFLRKPALADLVAETRLLKLGKQLAVGDVTIYSDGVDGPVAHASLTYSIPPRNGQ